MRKLKIFQKGWNLQQDGPGNRLVYHLQGCNLACPWCANPEGIAAGGQLIARKEKLLPEVCPHGAIRGQAVDKKVCATCKARECITLNPNEGIKLSCKEYSVNELMDEVRASRHLFHGGGGVTLSGGEPTIQFESTRAFLDELKAEGIGSAVETNGTHPRLPDLFPLIDTLIIDLKHYDDAKAKKAVGQGNKAVLKNISLAAELHGCVWLRITLIPGFNSSPDDIEQFVLLVSGLPQKHLSVELLSYHEYGRVKWEQCGMNYNMNCSAIPKQNVAEYESKFRKAEINVVRT